jgi:dihydroorotate dehydrogenase
MLSRENIDEKEAKTEMRIRSIAMTGAGLLCVGAALAEVGKRRFEKILKVLQQELSEKDMHLLQDALKDYRSGRGEP